MTLKKSHTHTAPLYHSTQSTRIFTWSPLPYSQMMPLCGEHIDMVHLLTYTLSLESIATPSYPHHTSQTSSRTPTLTQLCAPVTRLCTTERALRTSCSAVHNREGTVHQSIGCAGTAPVDRLCTKERALRTSRLAVYDSISKTFIVEGEKSKQLLSKPHT